MNPSKMQKRNMGPGRMKRLFAILLLLGALQFAAPSAHAQLGVVYDPTNHAQNILTTINLILQQIQHALKSVIDTARDRLLNEAQKRMHQAEIDGARMNAQNQQNATINTNSVMSDAPQACPLARAGAAMDDLSGSLNGPAASIQQTLLRGRGTGRGADPGSPAARLEQSRILCKAGLRDPIGNQERCRTLSTEDSIYKNAHLLLSSVLDPLHTPAAKVDSMALQYSLPPKVKQTDSGFVTFSDTDTISSTGDELAFIAAWEFCQILVPPPAITISSSRPATVADQLHSFRAGSCSAKAAAAADRCFEALRYRTACSKATEDVFKSANGTSCYKIQKAMCHFLKDAPPNGLGMTSGHPSLDNCDDNGLSAAEYERLTAMRCKDQGYLQTLHKDLDAPSAEQFVLNGCNDLQRAFKQERRDEKSDLEHAIATLGDMMDRGQCAPPPSVGDQPVGTPSTGGGATP